MTDWDLLTPGIGLTAIGIVGVGISLSGIAKTFIDGMHAVSLLTMFIGMIFLAPGIFKDGFPMSGRAKSATFITLGFLVTFGVAAAVTVSAQVPSIYAYIGLMMIIAVPAAVLSVASFRQSTHLKAMAIIFISGAIVASLTFYAFGLVAPRPPEPPAEEEEGEGSGAEAPAAGEGGGGEAKPPAINAIILAGASAQNNPDYDPETFTISKGEVAQWTNNDNAPHTVTNLPDGKIFDSAIINAGGVWSLDTSELEAGEYDYYCTLHPHMKAKFTVSEASGGQSEQPAAATTTAPPAEGSGAASEGSEGQAPAAPPAAGSGGATVTTVAIPVGASVPTNNEFFVPQEVSTSVGSMVTWRNDDTALHTATSGNAATVTPDGVFDSQFLKNGQTYSFVFEKPGEYDYYCMLHPFMTGKVTVN